MILYKVTRWPILPQTCFAPHDPNIWSREANNVEVFELYQSFNFRGYEKKNTAMKQNFIQIYWILKSFMIWIPIKVNSTMFEFFPVFFILYYTSFAKDAERFLDPLSTIQKQDKNKLGLSCAKLNSSLASYARCANCFQLDCLSCKNCPRI